MTALLIVASSGALASTIQMENLNRDLMRGWDVKFTDSKYRDLNIHFNESKVKPRWSEIIDDAGLRYGLAYLVDMENEQLIITRANDGIINSGIHYVQPRILEQQNRYNWHDLLAQANLELSQHQYDIEFEADLRKAAEVKETRREIESRVTWSRNYHKNKYDTEVAKNNELTNRIIEQNKKLTTQKIAKNDQLTKDTIAKNNQTLLNSLTKNERDHARRIEILNKRQMQIDKEHKAKTSALEEQKRAAEIKKAEYTALIEHTEKNAQAAELQQKYFPDSKRYVPSGKAATSIANYLLRHWDYRLNWSDELVVEDSLKSLRINQPIRFSDSIKDADLRRDVSIIACTLTRDTPHLSFYTEIDPDSRIIFMQLHQTSEDLRQQLISQCY
ncbi:hypothetical protein AB4653_00920 [Vibrio sp. 10N.222.48.A3]|uniref:hypothetical protein n=1 Tax=unclassified Vibrio TaxID=2614977 RepID=UPI00354D9C8C